MKNETAVNSLISIKPMVFYPFNVCLKNRSNSYTFCIYILSIDYATNKQSKKKKKKEEEEKISLNSENALLHSPRRTSSGILRRVLMSSATQGSSLITYMFLPIRKGLRLTKAESSTARLWWYDSPTEGDEF